VFLHAARRSRALSPHPDARRERGDEDREAKILVTFAESIRAWAVSG
jgi:hypothetical protein